MLDRFKGLSVTNKIAIAIPIAIAAITFFISEPNRVDNSPVVTNPTGDVTIIYNDGLTPEVFNQLKTLFNEKVGLSEQDTDSTRILTSVIDNYLAENTAHKQSIAELTEIVSVQAERIKNLLDDDDITKEVKALISSGQIIEAEKLVDNAQIEREDKKLAAKHYEKGRVKELRLKYGQAKESFGKAAALQPENTTYLNAFANILYDLAEYDKAIGYYELALASNLATFGEDHPNVATTRNNLGSAWNSKGEYDKAIGYYELALASDLATFGEDHPKVATRRNNLGGAWDSKGEYDKAIGYYERALATMKKVLGDHNPNTQTVQKNLEHTQSKMNQ